MENSAKYRQFKVSLNPEIVCAFKDTCAKSSVSMASVISQFMVDYTNMSVSVKTSQPDYSTRRRRRTAIAKMAKQLEQVRDSEQEYCDRIPENLSSSVVYDRANEFVERLDEVIDLITSV